MESWKGLYNNVFTIISIFTDVESSKEDSDTFPSISSISRDDGSFSIPQPSLDLAPTDLAENSPMSFSIPSLQLQLEETDFAKNAPMSFNITQPEFDLQPSFAFENLEEAPKQGDVVSKKETPTEDELPLEKQVYPKEDGKSDNKRRKRQGDKEIHEKNLWSFIHNPFLLSSWFSINLLIPFLQQSFLHSIPLPGP